MGRTLERGSVDKTKERTQGTMSLFVKVQTRGTVVGIFVMLQAPGTVGWFVTLQTKGTVVGRFVMLRIQDTGDGKCKSSIS